MNKLILYTNEYNINKECISFLDPVRNKITDGLFAHIIYFGELFTTNTIHYSFYLNVVHMGHFFNKNVYKFNPVQNSLVKIKYLESYILTNYGIHMTHSYKTPRYKIQEICDSGNIKINTDFTIPANCSTLKLNKYINTNMIFCLKIVGIWETDVEYGIIYKFLSLPSPLPLS